ncbi:hypothetical protein [Mycobacterium sp. AZCC_0083]|uniref:hypothetical protein n=1 Tax=Mycobacterium sp. AZCC_0083 TaxID=2735882 RepID=UPI0016075579|nr:hypothetical protein [Mycobacterium sp. AZCC_0083]MBB5168356.1 hypothetical protein [Mycobacterium sp. AZCC_0083]
MNAVAALHNAARRYCLDQIAHWQQAYAELSAAGKDQTSEPSGGGSDTEKAYGLFPRYHVLQAILSEVERSVPTDFDSIDTARMWLARAAETAQNPFTVNPNHPTEERAMAEERDAFVHFVDHSDEDDWWRSPPLPYRRVLQNEEADAHYQDFCKRWGQWYGANDQRHEDQCLTLHTDWVDVQPGHEQAIQSMLSPRVTRLIEIREYGDSYELDLQAVSFSYDGAEGYWFVDDLDWMIYASHESSITFGGDWLIQAVRNSTPDIGKYVYLGWERPPSKM